MTNMDDIKARVAECRRTGINVYRHADVQFLIGEVERLELALEYERDPSGCELRAGHHPRCTRVRYPMSLFGCSCAMEIMKARYLLDLHANGRCTAEVGSVDGRKEQRHPWLQAGRYYCNGIMSARGACGRRECEECGVSRYPDTDKIWRDSEGTMLAATKEPSP